MKRRQAVGYVALLTACWALSVAAGWTQLGIQLDNDIFDFLFRMAGPPEGEPQVAIAGIDEQSLNKMGGQPALRRIGNQTAQPTATREGTAPGTATAARSGTADPAVTRR